MSTQHTKIMFLLDGDYLEEQQVPQIYPDTLFFGGVEDEDTMSYSALPEIGSLLNEAEMKLTTIANAIPYSPGTYTMAVDNSPGSIHNMGLDPGNSSPQYLDMDSIDQSSMVSAELSCLSPPSHLQQQQQQSHLQQNSPQQQQQQNTFAGLGMAPSAAHAGLGGYHQELGSCDPMEQVKSLAVTQAMEDMHCACNQLHISPDPHSWTPRDVQCWVQWALQRYGVQPEAHAQNFQMLDGTSLCMLSEDDFKMRSLEAGSNLFVQLEIWKGAFASLNSLPPQISNNVHQQHQYPPQMLDTASPSSSFTDATSFTWHQPQPCDGFYTQGQGHIEQPFSPHYNGELSPASSCSSLDTACPDSEILTANNSDTQSEISEGGVGERTKHNIHLWQFLKELLQSPYHYQNCIRWVDRHQGIFKIEDSARVARLWGKRKNRPAMNYDKLSRSIRQYYKKGIIQKTEHSKRLVYQFCKPYLM